MKDKPSTASTHSPTHRVIRGGIFSGSSVFFSMAALLLVGKMVTNTVAPAQADLFFLLLLCADFLNLACNFGLANALPKVVGAASEEDQPLILRSTISFQALTAFLLSLLLLLLWFFLSARDSSASNAQWQGLLPYAWLIPPLFFVGVLRDTAMALHAGLHRYGHRALAIVAASTAQVALIFLCVWVMGGGITALTLCTIAAYALAVFWLLAPLPKRPLWNGPTLKRILGFSFPLYCNALIHFFSERFDTFLIAFLLGDPGAVAIYEIAKRFPLIISRALGAALTPFLPTMSGLLAADDYPAAARFLSRSYSLMAFLGYAGALGIFLLQEPLVLLLSNESYLQATQVMGLLCIAIALAVQTGLMGQTLIALGKPAYVTAINLVVAVLSVGANLVLIPRFGLLGAAIAALLAMTCSHLAQCLCVARQGLPIALLYWLRPQALMAFSCLILWSGAMTLPARLIALLCFGVGALFTGLVDLHDLRHLRTALLPKGKNSTS